MIDRGLRLRDLGTPVLSWSDLLSIVDNLPPDSAYVRARFPDDAPWAKLETGLIATNAEILSEIRWLLALTRFDEVPAEFGPMRYRPSDDTDDVVVDGDGRDVETARAAAESIRG